VIRVVLADDEPIIVKGLRKLLPWEELGAELVADAYDGYELMRAIEEAKPDIVISDISMPFMTGIDVLKRVKSKGLSTKVIFISAFQEFSYAKDAVAYGALDYLLKPVDKQQLEAVLLRAIAVIREEEEDVRLKEKLQNLERKNEAQRFQELLERLVEQPPPPGSPNEARLREAIKGPLVTVGVLELVRIEEGRWSEGERKLIEFAIMNIVQEMTVDSGRGFAAFKDQRIALFVQHGESEEPKALFEEIVDKIHRFLKLDVSIGMGTAASELGRVKQSYDEALTALRMKYFLGFRRVLSSAVANQLPPEGREVERMQLETIRQLTAGSWRETETAFLRLINAVRDASCGEKDRAVSSAVSFFLLLYQELKKQDMIWPEEFPISELASTLGSYRTFDEMTRESLSLLRKAHEALEDGSENKEKALMQRVKQYIEEHYAEDLTLDTVAGIAFMNPYYFSSFFKKHSGENFKSYLTEVRMNQACRLLAKTDLLVYEIAERVGYQNARHFSDMFKKRYGKLPNEYKQSLKG